MSQKELKAGVVIDKVISRTMTSVEAAAKLCVTDRTIRRMKDKVQEEGMKALAHGLRGRPSNHRMPEEEREEIASLLKERYADFKPGFASEKLREEHGIRRDPKTVRSIMKDLGLWKPKKRTRIVHRAWREPRSRYGEFVQYDGSYHHWLEDRGGTGELCLLAAIDDATGTVPKAFLGTGEGVLSTMGFWREYAEEHGLPQGIYLDKFSTYKMHMKEAAENADVKTQFSRAMNDLHVDLVFANSPQAKGRVERLFETLQDRLVKELRLKGISSVEEANRFIKDMFLPDFNQRFGRSAGKKGDLHRKLLLHEKKKLDRIFCKEETRVLTRDFTIPHGRTWYQLLPSPRLVLRPKDTVYVRTLPDGTVTLWVREKPVIFTVINKGKGRFRRSNIRSSNRTFLLPSYPDISISR